MFDCVVIGGGPAGLIASIQLKRSGLKVVLLERSELGGLLRNAHRVENYLGAGASISGKALVDRLLTQWKLFHVEWLHEEARSITRENSLIVTTPVSRLEARVVLVVTGTEPVHAIIPGEDDLVGKKIWYELAAMSPSLVGDRVALIGGSDAAFDQALSLHDRGCRPEIFARRDVRCLPLLAERVNERRIPVHLHSPVIGFSVEDDELVLDLSDSRHRCDAALLCVGRVATMPKIATENQEGIFFAGDVRSGSLRQLHIATGDAMKTAMDITRYLADETHS